LDSDKDPAKGQQGAFLALTSLPATPARKRGSFATGLVLNTAIFCAESTPDYQTGGKSQESPEISVFFSGISAGKCSGRGNEVLYGEIERYLFGTRLPGCFERCVKICFSGEPCYSYKDRYTAGRPGTGITFFNRLVVRIFPYSQTPQKSFFD
jgi:hypothetical protein